MDLDPARWWTEARSTSLRQQLNPCIDLLIYGNCLNQILILWIKREVLVQYKLDSIESLDGNNETEVLLKWCNEQWGHCINELFLEKKNQLDLISFRILRLDNQAVALELYHRLKAGESTFDSLARNFSIEADRNKETLRTNQRMGSLPIGFQKIIRTMKSGELTKPMKLDNKFILIRIEDFQPAEFSDSTKNKILMDQFASWASEAAKFACDRLLLEKT